MSDSRPLASSLLTWLRLNVAVILGLIAMLSMGMTVLWRTSDLIHQITDDHSGIESLHRDMASVDARLNEVNRDRASNGDAFRRSDADLERRVAVLEAQIQFLSTRVPTPQVIRK